MLVPFDNNQRYTFYPPSVQIDPGFYQLQRLFDDLGAIARIPDSALDITVDFHYCKFLNHTAVACLGGTARSIQARGGRIEVAPTGWTILRDV